MSREVGQLYGVARALMLPIMKFGWRLETTGLENVPTTGGAIMTPNHTSVIDSFFLPAVLPRRISYVGKAEYLDDWKTRKLFPALGMVPIDRSGGDAAKAALNTAQQILESGELFGIYPEGTRSRSGMLHKGHTGPARLARTTGCPIMPVGLIGTRECQPPDAPVPRPFMTIKVNIGKPHFADMDSDPMDPRAHRRLIDAVMFDIAQLSGQNYIDEYATKPKKPSHSDIRLSEPRSSAEVLSKFAA